MMGKFNLNQILNDASRQSAPGGKTGAKNREKNRQTEIRRISVYDLVPSEENFYSMSGIEELKSSIELAGKVLQNFVVVPLGDGKYKVISGHRRRLASLALAEEGKTEFEFVPCIVEENEKDAEIQAIREEIMLIAANSQREKTAWDKIEEARRTRALLERIKQQEKVSGNMRNLVAETLHTSATQIGRYDAISRNLCSDWMEEVKADRISLSVAYELSGLSAQEQQTAFEQYQKTGEISIRAAREKKQGIGTEKPPETPEPPKKAVSDPPQAAYTPPEAKSKEILPPALKTPQEPCIRAQETQNIPEEGAVDTITQLNDLVSYCMEMDVSGDCSREWSKDVGAISEALRLLEGRQEADSGKLPASENFPSQQG